MIQYIAQKIWFLGVLFCHFRLEKVYHLTFLGLLALFNHKCYFRFKIVPFDSLYFHHSKNISIIETCAR